VFPAPLILLQFGFNWFASSPLKFKLSTFLLLNFQDVIKLRQQKMSKQFTQKSFLFVLIVLAASAVVFFLVWEGMKYFNQVEPPGPNWSGEAPIINNVDQDLSGSNL
jgi:hypothetical protein